MRIAAAAVLFLLLALPSFAAQEEPVTVDAMGHPGLLLETSVPGAYLEAPAVSTEISLTVRGIVARGVVRQRFENPTDRCVEAIYVFPLADDAAVDAMRMKIGVRTIEGQIRERQEAAQVYEQAKSEGRSASLLEQHRPNLFTVSVASLGAGETAEIEIEYQHVVAYDDGRFSLRVPLAVAPRYKSGAHAPRMAFRRGSSNDVALTIDLDSGIALDAVTSTTHKLDATPASGTRVWLKPRDVRVAADRDFELTWAPRLGTTVHSAEFTETVGNDRYTLAMIFPPDVSRNAAAIQPREAIFIIDTSGSMEGASIVQARKALITALGRLRATDRFNVIEFNSTARKLFDESRRADRATIGEAIRWVAALESDGGTEMLSALQLALDGRAATPDEVRQVVFITDGQVGNESDVFEYIRTHVGGTRVFTIGIGNAPNTYFMRNAARAGRGTFTHISDLSEVEQRMTAMLRKLESPVVTNVAMSFSGGEQWPRVVPDLYAGEPLVVTVKNPKSRVRSEGVLQVEGEAAGIAKVWARQKIDAIRDSVFTGANADEVKKEIVATALAAHLVTEHTSLVAVDTTPNGVDAKTCTPELIPATLPAGWGGIEGSLPQGGTSATLWIAIGLAALLAAWMVRR
jgi:Ca-activated chloride channel homolog